MSTLPQRSWREQLTNVKASLSGPASDGQLETISAEQQPANLEVHRFIPKAVAPEPTHRAPQPAQETVDISEGRLTLKMAAGDVYIPLGKTTEAEILKNTAEYQRAIITEKKANIIATLAMAILTGLSALAIAFALAKGTSGKKDVPIL